MIQHAQPDMPTWFRDHPERLHRQRQIDAWVMTGQDRPKAVYPDEHVDGLLERFRKLFHNKCIYCERRLDRGVEACVSYFRPWENARLSHVDSPLDETNVYYIWLGWEWSNLYLACKECVRNKGNAFPLRDPAGRAAIGARGAALRNERPLILDPCDAAINPLTHISFAEDGSVVGTTLEGTTTIEVLALDRKSLRDTRREEVERLRVLWEQALQVSAQDREALVHAIAQLEGRCAADQPFAGMARQLLHRWRHTKSAMGSGGRAKGRAWQRFTDQLKCWNDNLSHTNLLLAGKTTSHHGYALLVGVGRTAFAPWSLPITRNDALAIWRVLADPRRCAYPESNVRVLSDESATVVGIKSQLEWLASEATGDATVIVYFSGHGWRDEHGAYYLLPHDVDPRPSKIASTALSAEDFTAALRQIKARRLLVILDCCHAGGMATPKGGSAAAPTGLIEHLRQYNEPPPFSSLRDLSFPSSLLAKGVAEHKGIVDDLRDGSGRAVFSSSQGNELSYIEAGSQLSLFTKEVIRSLEGAGSPAGEPRVWLSHVMHHLWKEVRRRAHALGHVQQPFFELVGTDFPIALLQALPYKENPDRESKS